MASKKKTKPTKKKVSKPKAKKKVAKSIKRKKVVRPTAMVGAENEKFDALEITDEMRTSFIAYANANNYRTIPNISDGLKPSQRRILHAAWGVCRDRNAKCGLIVGEAIKYIPHGDLSIYNSVVNMSQPIKNNIPILTAQGNFGSVISNYGSVAAMRYTEARMSKFCKEMFFGPELKYVPNMRNYADTEDEPMHLPAKLPVSLINGVSGIGSAFVSVIPSHKPLDVINKTIEYVKNKKISYADFYPKYVSGGHLIVNKKGKFSDIYKAGTGSYFLMSDFSVELIGKKYQITIHTLPNSVAVEKFITDINIAHKHGKINRISKLEDISDGKDGVCVVITLKLNTDIDQFFRELVTINSFMKMNYIKTIYTDKEGNPKLMSLEDIFKGWYETRVTDLTVYYREELKLEKDRVHNLKGLLIAVTNGQETQRILYDSTSMTMAYKAFKKAFGLDKGQVDYIVSKTFRSYLNKAGNIAKEVNSTEKLISTYTKKLSDIDATILEELENIKHTEFDDGIAMKTNYTKIFKTYKVPLKDDRRLFNTGVRKNIAVLPVTLPKQ